MIRRHGQTACCGRAMPLVAAMAAALIPAPLAAGELLCPKSDAPPVIDGAIEAQEWRGAAVVDTFYAMNTSRIVTPATRVMLRCDNQHLYLAAECPHRPGHVARPGISRNDDLDIFRDDALEIFIAPRSGRPRYLHLAVNDRGAIFDAEHGWRRAPGAAWNIRPRPQVATKTAAGMLTIELALPLAAFAPIPAPGEVWGIRFCRTLWDRTPKTTGERPGNLNTVSVPDSEYHTGAYQALIFTARGAETAEMAARLNPPKGRRVHVYHHLEEVKRTCVWSKPGDRLRRDGRQVGERLIYTDAGTEATVYRATWGCGPDFVHYANVYPWNADGSLLAFRGRKRPGGGTGMLMAADATAIWPAKVKLGTNPWTRDDPLAIFMPSGHQLVKANVLTGAEEMVCALPEGIEGTVRFGPYAKYAVVFQRGFGEDAKLTVMHTATGRTQSIRLATASKDFAGDWLYGGGIRYIGDVPHVFYSLNHLPHLSPAHPYQQWAMNLQTGEFRQVKYLSHGGTSPTRTRKVGYGRGNIYTTDWFGDDKQFVMRVDTGGHIAWMSSPEWCLAGTSGKPNRGPFANQLLKVYVDTGNWHRIAYAQTANEGMDSDVLANTSPDGTKVQFTSTMLGPRHLYWAVIQWPEPPLEVQAQRRVTGVQVSWSAPTVSKEIKGYRVWRAAASGGPYALVSGREPVPARQWTDPAPRPDEAAFYVVTSLEYSALESRRFSNETAVGPAGTDGWPGKIRRYVEAETGETLPPLATDFQGSASCDVFVVHRHGQGTGALTVRADLANAGRYTLWGRVRGTGTFRARADGRSAGTAELEHEHWTWVTFATVPLAAAAIPVTFETSDRNLAIDKILLTDDLDYTPTGTGDTAGPGPPAPGMIQARPTAFDVSLTWTDPGQPDIHHYQVYRGRTRNFTPAQPHLVGSPDVTEFLDWGLTPGTQYHYCVTAVDAFGNASPPARAATATAALANPVRVEVEAETGIAGGGRHEVREIPGGGGGKVIVTPPETITREPYRLELPFEVPGTGRYMVWIAAYPVADTHIYLRVGVDDGQKIMFYAENASKGEPAARLMWRPLGGIGRANAEVYTLAAGRHVLHLSHVGQKGFQDRITAIDRIIVTNDLSFVPEGRLWQWDMPAAE